MARAYDGTVAVRATPATVFALWADAASWPRWDPDVRAATREGPFAVGATGTVTPKQGPTMALRITKVEPDRAFDAETRLPGCTMRFEHWMETRGASTIVTHRVVLAGPLAWLFGLLIGPSLRKGIPGTMAGLQAAAEAREAGRG